ncbi:YqzE family protein [Paenibacillus lemnae]|uniref:YqzE family protein n=1 Tax=Paenibacillus lemnae TaxID=1330551 RepID=A0A848M5G0_PAELE|nr:YqzE family protein [Paenibacillus lemnae]NMO95342.1 YqzE family protein [Paenibacillus lemnae]
MASSDELIKYITQRVVRYIDTPKEIRKSKPKRETWSTRWFGMIPFSMSLWKEELVTKTQTRITKKRR